MPLLERVLPDRWLFFCPGCKDVHQITDSWGVDAETLTVEHSILVNAGRGNPAVPKCHSFIRNGRIEYLVDCDHEKAGIVVDMVEVDS